jgi:3-methylcrotonyl-CoA carboxylase alpha subunit
LAIDGHAIEARVYAEDPAQDFLPMAGPIAHLAMPAADRHLRVDIGVRAGDQVSIHYDPMIAKLIVWDADRAAALRRLRAALSKAEIVGVATNLDFLAALAAHPAFAAGEIDTGFIGRYRAELLPVPEPAGDTAIALACLYLFLGRTRHAAELAAASGDPWSPWHRVDGWRLNDDNHHRLTLLDGEREVEIDVHYRGDGYLIESSGGSIAASGRLDAAGGLVADLDGARAKATVVRQGAVITVLYRGRPHRLVLRDPLAGVQMDEGPAGALEAPMPGRVAAVLVAAGQAVKKGAPLMLLEAMKMEHSITAPLAGTIEAVHYAAGDQVEAGATLLSIAARDA